MKRDEQKVLLLILDGWGIRKERKDNAIKLAKTPVIDKLWKTQPHAILKASGTAVGLPKGYMGNSEVGHTILGAGRILDTDLVRINKSIKDGSFFRNKALLEAVNQAKNKKQKLHLMGLLSDAGVHSHIDHLFALLELAKKKGVKEVYVHAFLDGRDTPPKAAGKFIQQLQRKMEELGVGRLATMMGRFYAMDRDNRWNREHKAYECMVDYVGRKDETDPLKALEKAYAKGETDEFIQPTILINKCVVDEDDSIIFFNFRSDRARELTRAFVWGKFKEFKRKKIIGLKFVTLTQYDSLVKVPVAFLPIIPEKTLGEVISLAGISQLRLAETEKWAHVTYFFNGLCEHIFPHEKRIHVQSIKRVKTYDRVPEMKVKKITSTLLKNIKRHDFFVVNFANCDMVGHTGNLKATIKAVEAVDKSIGNIVDKFPGAIFITADHGNCEEMGKDHETAHSTNDVPLIVVNGRGKLKNGGLADVAPTILDYLKIKKPKEMTGKSLY
ncbi:MAG: 2,3-bisphosphoglycerate-independent phosphoglycerate mutase [Nanoarchaeota archaeon]|nr:2,3-bisphosphoglycerate-independent phosphoglycerate mutase [Nanoarchaeota archaeon]MBU1631869.1 2,3-bisphosphoglycerate-independent phosphoglycerate mutase [Nanoarchaeota archaeon]MBU1876074.1 2,3-bisphosphoglycerate-independent phosphoglycerate mutase [Nanoarchaeota archaeon]